MPIGSFLNHVEVVRGACIGAVFAVNRLPTTSTQFNSTALASLLASGLQRFLGNKPSSR